MKTNIHKGHLWDAFAVIIDLDDKIIFLDRDMQHYDDPLIDINAFEDPEFVKSRILEPAKTTCGHLNPRLVMVEMFYTCKMTAQ